MAIELKVKSDSRQAQADLRKLNQSVENIDKTTKDSVRGLKRLAIGAAAAFAAIGAGSAITNVTDSYRRLEARIALTNKNLNDQVFAFKEINKIALETRSNQESLADLYSRIGRATRQLGVEQKTVIKVTRSIAQAITISGSSAESANSAIVQLGQGLAAGALRGQELNSVMEQTPAVAQAIARGMGITIGDLRQFANEGKLSAQAVIDALAGQSDAIDKEFARVPVTFAQSLLVLSTGVGRVVNEVDQVLGATGAATRGFQNLGINLNASAVGIGASVQSTIDDFNRFREVVSPLFSSIGELGQAFAYLGTTIIDTLVPDAVLDVFEDLIDYISDTKVGLKQVESVVDVVSSSIRRLARGVVAASDALNSMGGNIDILDRFRDLNRDVAKVTSDLLKNGLDNVKKFGQEVKDTFYDIWKAVVGNSYWPDTINGVVDYTDKIQPALDRLRDFASNVKDAFYNIESAVMFTMSRIIAIFSGFAGLVLGALGALNVFEQGSNKSLINVQGMYDALTDKVKELKNEIGGLKGLKDIFGNVLKEARSIFDSIVSNVQMGLSVGLGVIISYLKFGFAGVIAGAALIFTTSFSDSIDDVLSNFGTSISGVVRQLGESGGQIGAAIAASIPMLIGLFADVARGFVDGFLSSIPLVGGLLSNLVLGIDSLFLNLASAYVGGYMVFFLFGKAKLAGILTALTTVKNAIMSLTLGTQVASSGGMISNFLFGSAGVNGGAATLGLLAKIRTGVISAYTAIAAGNVVTGASITAMLATVQFGIGVVLARTTAAITGMFAMFTGAVSGALGLISRALLGPAGVSGLIALISRIGATLGTRLSTIFMSRSGGRGGLIRRAMFGAAGAAALLLSVNTFADDSSSSLTSTFATVAEVGLIGAMIFGAAGIGAALSVIGTALAAISAKIIAMMSVLLVHPVFLAITAVVAGGTLGLYLFGSGNTFESRLDNSILRLAEMVGLADELVDQGTRIDLLNRIGDVEIPDNRVNKGFGDIAKSSADLFSNQRMTTLNDSEFTQLLPLFLEQQRANDDLIDIQQTGNFVLDDQLKAQRRLVNSNERIVAATKQIGQDRVLTAEQFLGDKESREDSGVKSELSSFFSKEGFVAFSRSISDTIGVTDSKVTELYLENNRLEQGQISLATSQIVEQGTVELKRLAKQYDVDIPQTFLKNLGDTVERSKFQESLGDDSDISEVLDIDTKFRLIFQQALRLLNMKGFTSKLQTAFREAGVEVEKLAIDLMPPGVRSRFQTLINNMENARAELSDAGVKDLAERTKEFVKAKAELVKASADTGSSSNRLNTRLSGAGIDSRVSNIEFGNFSADDLAGVNEHFTAIVDLQTDIDLLNGNDLETEKLKLAQIERRRDALENILNLNKGISSAISDSNISQQALSRLTDNQLNNVISHENTITSLKAQQELLGKDEIARYKEINNLIDIQEKRILKIIDGSASISDKVANLSNINVNLDVDSFSKRSEFVQRRLLELGRQAQEQLRIINDPTSTDVQILTASNQLDLLGQAGERFVDSMRRGQELARGVQSVFQSSVKEMLLGGSLEDVLISAATRISESFLDAMLEQMTTSMFTDGGMFSGMADGIGNMFAGGPGGSGSAVGTGAAALTGDIAGEAAEGLTTLTASTEAADGGILSWLSGVGSSIASALGFGTATATAGATTTTAAATTVTFATALTAATVAATTLATSLTAAASASLIPGFSTGGYVSGPGTGTSDSILARLSNGEYVMNAKSVREHGALLHAINTNGNIPAFAKGGPVGESLPVMSLANQGKAMNGQVSQGGNLTTNIHLQVTGDVTNATRKAVREMGSELANQVENNFKERGVLNG